MYGFSSVFDRRSRTYLTKHPRRMTKPVTGVTGKMLTFVKSNEEEMIKVACIGDSITWGFTLLRPSKQSYPALLQEKPGPNIFRRDYTELVKSYSALPRIPASS